MRKDDESTDDFPAPKDGDDATRAAPSPPASKRSSMPAPTSVGSYLLEDRLGEGAQATVWRALHRALGRPAAIKLVHERFAADPVFAARFQREARLVAKLSHPNVVSVYDSGVDDGWLWMAMELVDGQPLSARMKRGAPIDERRAVAIALDLAQALDAAAAHGITHRDVKPANVLLTADGTAKLSDLGMAREQSVPDSETATGIVVGTPAYMSPEQAFGERDLDVRSDIYPLGLILYEMVSGELPLRGKTPMGTLVRHSQEDVPPLRDATPDASPALDAVVRLMTAREREKRYPDARSLVHDLIALRDGAVPPLAGRGVADAAPAGSATVVNGATPPEGCPATSADASPLPHPPAASPAPRAARRRSSGNVPTRRSSGEVRTRRSSGKVPVRTAPAADPGAGAARPSAVVILAAAAILIVCSGAIVGFVLGFRGKPGPAPGSRDRPPGTDGQPDEVGAAPTVGPDRPREGGDDAGAGRTPTVAPATPPAATPDAPEPDLEDRDAAILDAALRLATLAETADDIRDEALAEVRALRIASADELFASADRIAARRGASHRKAVHDLGLWWVLERAVVGDARSVEDALAIVEQFPRAEAAEFGQARLLAGSILTVVLGSTDRDPIEASRVARERPAGHVPADPGAGDEGWHAGLVWLIGAHEEATLTALRELRLRILGVMTRGSRRIGKGATTIPLTLVHNLPRLATDIESRCREIRAAAAGCASADLAERIVTAVDRIEAASRGLRDGWITIPPDALAARLISDDENAWEPLGAMRGFRAREVAQPHLRVETIGAWSEATARLVLPADAPIALVLRKPGARGNTLVVTLGARSIDFQLDPDPERRIEGILRAATGATAEPAERRIHIRFDWAENALDIEVGDARKRITKGRVPATADLYLIVPPGTEAHSLSLRLASPKQR